MRGVQRLPHMFQGVPERGTAAVGLERENVSKRGYLSEIYGIYSDRGLESQKIVKRGRGKNVSSLNSERPQESDL